MKFRDPNNNKRSELLCEQVYALLIDAAQKGKTVYYDEISRRVELSRDSFSLLTDILDAIAEYEHEQSRPLLTAVAVQRDSGLSGPGFFGLARRLRSLSGWDEQGFYEMELSKVYRRWTTR